jgi:putative drug exporter of the RND superfamily
MGVLLDTFVVRALLVPALTHLCGERAWWPGRVR